MLHAFFASVCNQNTGGNGGGGNGGGGGSGGGGDGLIQSPDVLNISPNPSNGRFNIDLLLNTPQTEAMVFIQDLNGKEIYKTSVSVFDNRINHQIRLHQLSSGIYFIKVQSGNDIFSEKIMIE